MSENKAPAEKKTSSDQLSQDRMDQLKSHADWSQAETIIKTLQKKGFEALIAGGAVRDLLMERAPGDLDIATSATPDEVEALFPKTVAVGKAFGVIRVIDHQSEIEVATYRKDLAYQDGRRPTGVEFVDRIEDAERRDFTVNALFYDPIQNKIYDDVGGAQDIEKKILKCVGDAAKRFQEDELRRLRLVRFVAQLGFEVESATEAALKKNIEGLAKVSRERITDEIEKMWSAPYLEKAFQLFKESGMAKTIDPAWDHAQFLPRTPNQTPSPTKLHAWLHYFSFFFGLSQSLNQSRGQNLSPSLSPNLRPHLEKFRLPKDLEKQIETAYRAYQNADAFLKLSTGEQKLQAQAPGFIEGLRYRQLHKPDGDLKSKITELEKAPTIPEPLVKAVHIQTQFQGAALGQKLKELYIYQLDQNLTEVDEVLAMLNGPKVQS